MSKLSMNKLGLYIHIPFCLQKCPYCDFYSVPYEKELKGRYLQALEEEIKQVSQSKNDWESDSLYIGGGTPSLLKLVEVEGLINLCQQQFNLAGKAEVTLEANPDTIYLAKLQGYLAAGVNRLSLGFQSFIDKELHLIDRLHTVKKAQQIYAYARKAGFENISIDMMLGLPEQKIGQWEYSLRQVAQLMPEHISTYILELKGDSFWVHKFPYSPPTEETIEKMYNLTIELLTSQGYEHYEISNFCLPGFASYHNLKYWSGSPYFGFGPSAHSFYQDYRYHNVSDVSKYINLINRRGSAVKNKQVVTEENRLEEALFLGLRKTNGIEIKAFKEIYGVDVEVKYAKEISHHQDAGLIEIKNGFLKLTRKGLLLSNEVFQAFLVD